MPARSNGERWRGRPPCVLRLVLALMPALVVGAGIGTAAAQQAPPSSVTVRATRDPVDKSYRKMVLGVERYEAKLALAPHSTLRFQLLPRTPQVQLDGVELKIVGDSIALPVALAADHSFALERNAQALREDADLIANRKTDSMTWRADVRSAGVPEGMRRLGDLRLECLVGMTAGLVSNNARLFAWLSDWLADPERVCNSPDGNYLFFSERPLFGVTLRAGARTRALPFRMLYAGGTQTADTLPFCDCQSLLERSYYAPLWDRSWPDDTLLSFEDMDENEEGAAPSILGDKARVRAAYGPAAEIRFGSGAEVWLYPQSPAPGRAELAILFDRDGKVRKSSRHPAGAGVNAH